MDDDYDFFDENSTPSTDPTAKKIDPQAFRDLTQNCNNASDCLQQSAGGTRVAPRNEIEEFLADMKIFVFSEDNQDYFLIDSDQNHLEIIEKLEIVSRVRMNQVMDSMESAMKSPPMLELYLSPLISKIHGNQDTILKAFLVCKQSQEKTFEVLMHHLNALGQRQDKESEALAQACIAQLRHIEFVYNGRAMLEQIESKDFFTWNATVRDGFIAALPEIIAEPYLQQEIALLLREHIKDEMARETVRYQKGILDTLHLLRTTADVAKQLRRAMCQMAMYLRPEVLPQVASFAICSLATDKTSTLADVLLDLATFIKLEQLSLSSRCDPVVCEIFVIMDFYFQMNKKYFKDIGAFLSRGNKTTSEATETNEEVDSVLTKPQTKPFDVFELLLLFSVANSPSCPPSVVNNFKTFVTASSEQFQLCVENMTIVTKFSMFVKKHLQSILLVTRQFIWTQNELVQQFGEVLYKDLFNAVEESQKKEVLDSILQHFGNSDEESKTMLDTLTLIADSNREELKKRSALIMSCTSKIDLLSHENVKKLFKMLLSLQDDNGKATISQQINKYTTSNVVKWKKRGLLGLLALLEEVLRSESSSRESHIKKRLEELEILAGSDQSLRTLFYQQAEILFQEVLKEDFAKSESVLAWSKSLLKDFRNDFFIEQNEPRVSSTTLESSKFVTEEVTTWMKTPGERLDQAMPIFELIKTILLLNHKWSSDDAVTKTPADVSSIFFAFEANISMEEVSPLTDEDSRESSTDRLFFAIQWIRTILNTFSSSEYTKNQPQEKVESLLIKKYSLMVECERQLVGYISILKQWKISESLNCPKLFVVSELRRKRKAPSKPSKGAKKATSASFVLTSPEETTPEPEEVLDDDMTLNLKNIDELYYEFRLPALVKLFTLIDNKRKATLYLLGKLLPVLNQILPKKEKKLMPWLSMKAIPKTKSNFHGDTTSVWKSIKKLIPPLWKLINTLIVFFEDHLNSTSVDVHSESSVTSQCGELLAAALKVLHAIFVSKDIADGAIEDDRRKVSKEKRIMVMQCIEREIIAAQEEETEEPEDGAEGRIAMHLYEVAKITPSPDVGVAILDLFSTLNVSDATLKKKMSRVALAFIKKEWHDESGNVLKGASFNTNVRSLLERYLSFRHPDQQMEAILWLMCHKVALLVPSEERSQSVVYDVSTHNVAENDDKEYYHCINKNTFGTVYKTLFSSLNLCLSRKSMQADALKQNLVTVQECVEQWVTASSCFTILSHLLRIASLRSNTVLATAIKEGKKFLILFSKNSSFMYLLENLPKGKKFVEISTDVEKVIRVVQQGNRVLQNIGNYAKSSKSVSLLKIYPELRAASELCLRIVHTALVSSGCEDAFVIGHMKSRTLDGGEIVDQEEVDRSDGETEANTNDSSDDDSDACEERSTSPVY